MIELFIAGLVLLVIGFPLAKILERRGSRWSNLVLALFIAAGIICIGIFAWL